MKRRDLRDEWRGMNRSRRLKLREEWRLYYGRHLHRRFFLSFAMIFVMALVVVGVVIHVATKTGHNPRPLWLLAVAALVVWKASGSVARRIARPLYELVRVAGQLGGGNLRARASLSGKHGFDEIAALSRAVNDMADRIEKQLHDQRELLAGVSHELRTPLGHLRVLLDTAREQGGTETTYAAMEREIVEIDALVGSLLASARLEFQAVERVLLDPAAAARQALVRAGVNEATLVDAAAGTQITADPTLLARALANLLDNARKHGGGVQTMRVRAAGDVVAFDVEDGGPGFADGQTAPRPGPRPEGSLGLGLSLVERIARAHGGHVATANRAEGGARVTLELPVRPPPA